MSVHILSNLVLAERLAEIRKGLDETGCHDAWLDVIDEAAGRLSIWDVRIEQIEEVRRKQAEARRESAPLRRARVRL